MKAGHWDEALRLARLRLDAGDAAPDDLAAATACLQRLNRIAQTDALIEQTIARYGDDALMLMAAMEAYAHSPHYGHEVAGEFRRGPQRGGQSVLSVEEADRVRILRLGVAALDNVGDDDDSACRVLAAMRDQLSASRMGRQSWRLQLLTDLDAELPEPVNRWGGRSAGSDPPVNADGDAPLLYEVPESWRAAKNDGERWRWTLAEAVRRCPSTEAVSELAYADFLRDQFGVQTLARQGWFRPLDDSDDGPMRETSALAVETLDDAETIARLATGVRRFALPEGHRYLELYEKHKWWRTVAEIYLNRNQRAKAVEATKKALAKAENAPLRDSIQLQLDQLVDPWVRFEPSVTRPAGEGAELRVTHRNAASVRLVARPVNVRLLLDDIRAYLAEPKEQEERFSLDVENLGWRLVHEGESKYVGEQVAEWTVDLETPTDHRDGQSPITSPLQNAGAYLVEATPVGASGQTGAANSVVVWVANTVLLRKPTASGELYQVLDARDGRPIEGATVRLLGYRQVHDRQPDGQFQRPRVELRTEQATAGSDGVAMLDLAEEDGRSNYTWLATARTDGGRFAHLGFSNVWRRHKNDNPPDNPRTYFVTDRPVYRPGDTLHFKAWIGKPDYLDAASGEGEAEPSEYAHQEFQVELRDARGETIDTQRLTADAYGGVVGSHKLSEVASLGQYWLHVAGFGGTSLRVEEYRKPEFEVVVDAPDEPTRLGDSFEATVRATYYAGTLVRGGSVRYKVVRTRKTERWFPPGPWDWLYGRGYGWLGQDATWRRDWRRWGCFAPIPPWWSQPSGPPEVVAEGEARLDGAGELKIPIDTAVAKERQPNDDHQYEITAEVTDAGRRTLVGLGSVLAARRPVNVTVWLGRGYYETGDTVRANISVRRPDGKPVAGEGELRLLRIGPPTSDDVEQLDDPNETLVQSWRVATDSSGAADMRLKASEPGRYRLTYRSDAAREPVEGGAIFTIRGPEFDGDGFRYGALELVPDMQHYAPGETVRLLVNTDQPDSTVTLFLRPVGGVYEAPRVLRVAGKSEVVEIPVGRGDMPNFFVEAHTVADGKVHTVTRQIVVPPESRVLQVEALPSATTYLPGEEGSLRVRLTNDNGEPVVGVATIAVYDRSVDAVAGGPVGGDIREAFWDWTRDHHPATTHSLSRSEWPVTAPGVPGMQNLGVFGDVQPRRGTIQRGIGGRSAIGIEPMPMAAMADGLVESAAAPAEKAAEDSSGVAVRKNFADTALWVGTVETDAEGFATVPMPLPESLTAWKIRVWAVAPGLRVGQAEAEAVTRKDLMVRLRAPRFLVERDEATLSALVQNESQHNLTVRVRLESDGGVLSSPASPEQVVEVAASGEALVDWRVSAKAEGEATLRVVATVEQGLSDGVQVEMPVLVHGAERVESFSAVLPPGEQLSTFELVVPKQRRPEATRLEVRYSPTLVGSMLDALPYLIEFPHGCTEQTLNRFLPAAVVRHTLKDVGVKLADLRPAAPADGPPRRPNPVFDEQELDRVVAVGVQRLVEMQISDGGWGWFTGFGERSAPHTTAVVVRGLGLAQRSGVEVPAGVVDRGLDWLKQHRADQLERLANVDAEGNPIDDDLPWKRYADNLDALVELTLCEAGRPSEPMLGRLYEDRLKLAPYSLATLGLALHEASGADALKALATERRDGVVRNLRQYVETDDENQTAYLNLPGGYWWRWYGSEYEAHAYFLKLLAATDPKGDLAPRLVKYLLSNRRHATRWNSTRDTALVVEAMTDYFRASGESAAEGAVEVWLDGKLRDTREYAADDALRFDGRFVLEGESLSAGRHTLELRKRGEGRLYAGASLTNFSLEEDIRAAGLEVRVNRRVHKLVPIDARQDDVDSRGGLMSSKVERYRRVNVPNLGAVESGDLVEVELTVASKNDYEYLVIEDPKAAGFEPVETRSGYNGNELGAFVEFRDQSVRFYVQNLARGERTVRYRLRAETPGQFSALPAQISAMYAPDLRGNSDEVRLNIKDSE